MRSGARLTVARGYPVVQNRGGNGMLDTGMQQPERLADEDQPPSVRRYSPQSDMR